MPKVQAGKLPEEAISINYVKNNAYTDCFYIDIPGKITFEEYIESFYTTSLFKAERIILWLLARKPSSDEDVRLFSKGKSKQFSVWTVESRLSNHILLRDFTNKTRSWLMIEHQCDHKIDNTRLYFGSVVVPKYVLDAGQVSFGFSSTCYAVFTRCTAVHY